MQDIHYKMFLKLYIFGKKIQSLIKKHNLDLMSQGIILMILAKDSATVTQLADKLGIKVSAMSTRINVMEQAGLLKRIKSHDKRSNIATITALGKKEAENLKKSMQERCQGLKLGISTTDAQTLIILLNKINLDNL
jgi:DNA-binding MarR family transcriptional regulator